jgi:cell division protein FtsA
MSAPFDRGLTPKLRPLPPKRSAVLSVLDVGTHKVVCLIAKLRPLEGADLLPGRSHQAQILGIGHQRARGIKAGAVVDMELAELSIRQAVDAAERMAGVRVDAVIVNVSCGRIASEHYSATVQVSGHQVGDADIHRVLDAGASHSVRDRRAVLHSLPIGHTLDGVPGIREPRGMLGQKLGVDMHVVTAEASPAKNLMLAIERCHLHVEAMVATPYAAGLAALVDDEAEMGATVIDLGAGTTSVGVFSGRSFVHCDGIAVGGAHVTMDVARGLSTKLSEAERLKVLYGATIASPSDERETIAVPRVGDDDREATHQVARSKLVRIIRPRIEEILELVRDRLRASGAWAEAGRRVILTGGTAQLTGLPDLARKILERQVRVGRPLGVSGLPEAAKGAPFAASVGLLVYPQFAGVEHFEPQSGGRGLATGTDGYMARMGRWLKDSF